MKLSLQIRDEQQQNKSPLLRAKIPITVLGLPFISGIVAGDSSDLSFNLSTNFLSCPSLKLSYSPTANTPTNALPFSLSLKSGIGLFGSPRNSPLIISAHINPFSNAIPTFSLQFKPQFGHFSLHKETFSNPNPNPSSDIGSNSVPENGYVPVVSSSSIGWTDISLESTSEKIGSLNHNTKDDNGFGAEGKSFFWRDLKMDSCSRKDGILSGVKVRARTELPVTSKLMVNFRWGLNFPAELGKKLPFLTIDKICIHRVEEVKEEKKKVVGRDLGDVELLKGMCLWMSKDLEVLEKENRELKQSLEEIRVGIPTKNYRKESGFSGSKGLPPVENSSEFDHWTSKRNGGEEAGRKELKKSTNGSSDLESELQKAIKGAST